MEHRAAWDATFSAPKSVSLTALVGRDEAVRQAHRDSVNVALNETERFVQARMGGNRLPETTGKWIATSFEHDSARPVNGYAAPQLHTHVVFFNLTETKNGEARALQPHELYRSQQYATAIYRSELALRLKGQGYEIERGKVVSRRSLATHASTLTLRAQKSANSGLPRTAGRERRRRSADRGTSDTRR